MHRGTLQVPPSPHLLISTIASAFALRCKHRSMIPSPWIRAAVPFCRTNFWTCSPHLDVILRSICTYGLEPSVPPAEVVTRLPARPCPGLSTTAMQIYRAQASITGLALGTMVGHNNHQIVVSLLTSSCQEVALTHFSTAWKSF